MFPNINGGANVTTRLSFGTLTAAVVLAVACQETQAPIAGLPSFLYQSPPCDGAPGASGMWFNLTQEQCDDIALAMGIMQFSSSSNCRSLTQSVNDRYENNWLRWNPTQGTGFDAYMIEQPYNPRIFMLPGGMIQGHRHIARNLFHEEFHHQNLGADEDQAIAWGNLCIAGLSSSS